MIALSGLVLATSGAYAAGGIVTGTQTVSDQKIDGKQGNGYFVQSGTLNISNSLLANFTTTGGAGSGGGAGMGGAIFINSGASAVLDNVQFSGNTAVGGKGGVGTVGGSLNNLFNSGASGGSGANGSDAPGGAAAVNGGNGGNGYTGAPGGNASAGVGGTGGRGGDGSSGAAITADTIKAAIDSAYNIATSVEDGSMAAFYSALSTEMAALAASAGPNPMTSALAPTFTALAATFGAEAAGAVPTKVSADMVMAAGDAAYLTAITVTNLEVGVAGNGGSGGNGGKGGVGSTGYGGGQGGKGGNGGDAYGSSMAIGGAAGAGGTGGAGGFGAGGGSGGNGGVAGSDGSSATNDGVKGDGGDGGVAGFGGGDGSAGTGGNTLVGGNGGSGLGGSIFVREGGSLTIKGDTTFSRGKVRGGAGDVSNHGGSGDAAGTDLFMMKGSHVVLDAGTGKTITFNGTIADDSAASIDGYGTAEGDGASLTIKSGLVVFNGENTYTGQTIMAGGVLKAVDGDTLNASSNINFASNRDGGVLLLNSGVFDRYTGTSGERVQWTGSGGFAAIEQDLSVNLSGGLERVWGEEGFMSTPGHALILGSTESTHKVTLENDIDLNGQQGMVLVKANAANDNYGILNGVWHNGSLIVGDSQHTGVLIMTKTNSIDGGTTIAGGELRLQEQGALGDYAPVDVKTGATLDASSTGDQTIGTLTGGGDVKMGGNTLVLNQGSDTTFAGNIQDGGVAGGSAAGIVKNGNGTLRITGNNGYTGTTQINHGAIVLDGTLDSATINIAAGTSLSNNNGGLQSKAVLNNDGLLNQFSDDTIASLVNTGTINGSNTLTAKTYALNDGSVINANLGSGMLTSNDSVQINGRSAAETVNIHSGITTLGAAERLLDSSDVTVDGKLVMGGNEGIGTLAGSGVLELSGSRLTLNHDKTTTYGGVIQDNQNSLGSVQKNGSGTQILTGANTYRGDTVINAGTLALNDGGSLQSQQITIASGGTLDNHNQDNNGLSDTSRVSNAGLILQNSDDTIRTLVNSGTINGDKTLTADSYALNDGSVINANLGSGIVNANGSVAINGRSAAETVNIQSGTTTLGAAERLLDSSNVTVNANLVLGGDETIGTLAGNGSGNVDLNGGKLTLKQNSDTVFAGVIQDSENGSGSLQKDGSGTITLSGASSYTGHTQINSGRVVLNGSLQSHSVTVAQNATLDDNNGGLSPLAALSNDGVINLNADDTVASFSSTGTLNNAGHTLNAASYALNDGSVINANLGAGILTGNGNVLLNGSSQAATVLIASGITTLGAAERLLDSSAVTINGKLVMGGNESIGTLAGNSNGVLELSGSRLILNQSGNTSYAGIIQDSLGNAGSVQKDGSGTLTLGGSNTYRGSTRINSGKLVLDGSLQSQSVSIAQGATLDNQHGGLSATSALNNSGTLNQNADDSVKTLINSGTINGSGTLSADSYTLNNGAVVNANLGAGTLETHGNVTLNGTSQAENVHVYQASVLTLGGENRLNTNADAQVDGKLVLAGGNQTLGSLQGGGTVDITAYKLSVTRGGAFSGTINADSTDLDVSGTRLDLTQGTTTTQSTTVANGTTLSVTQGAKLDSDKTTVSQGGTLQLDSSDNLAYKTLTGNGTVNTGSGSFDNKAGSTVKGFLTFSGNYVNNGTLAPGNSPGLTTINGNFVNNGRFESEVQTTTAVSGYDQTRVGGSVTLSNSSALVVQTYGGTTPSRGNRYQIIADLSGNAKAVSGAFGSVSFDADGLAGSGVEVNNAAVVFDVATGQVLATGLNSAGSRFADLGNSSSQRAAAAALLKVATSDVGQNQINSATTAGNLAGQLIAANGSSASANAERFTPEYYGAMADNALRTGELVSGLLQQRVSSALDAATPAGQVSAFSGYLHDKMDAGADTDISRRDFYVGGEYRVSEVFTIGSVLLDGSGDLNARFGSGSSKVRAASLFARLSVNPSLDVLASVHHSSTDYQLSRSTMTGNSSGNTGATALTTSLAAVYRAQISPQLAILPRVGLSHGKASVGSMLEQGSAGDRLDLGGFDAQQTKAQIGATWLWSSLSQGGRWNVALDLGLEHAFSDSHGNMQATLVNDRRVSFPVTFANDSKTLLNVGVSANYAFSKNLSLSAALEGRSNVNGQSGKLGMNYTF